MTERQRIVRAIMDTLQKVYGDATQTVLDQAAAQAVWKRLLDMGVAPPSGVAAVIAAAGGEIVIPVDLLMDPPTEYVVMEDGFRLGATVLRAQKSHKQT